MKISSHQLSVTSCSTQCTSCTCCHWVNLPWRASMITQRCRSSTFSSHWRRSSRRLSSSTCSSQSWATPTIKSAKTRITMPGSQSSRSWTTTLIFLSMKIKPQTTATLPQVFQSALSARNYSLERTRKPLGRSMTVTVVVTYSMWS